MLDQLLMTTMLDMSLQSFYAILAQSCELRRAAKNHILHGRQEDGMPSTNQKIMVNTRVELATLALLAPRSNQLS